MCFLVKWKRLLFFLLAFMHCRSVFFLKINPKTFNGYFSDPLSQKCRSRGHFIGKPSNPLPSQERKKCAKYRQKSAFKELSVMFFVLFILVYLYFWKWWSMEPFLSWIGFDWRMILVLIVEKRKIIRINLYCAFHFYSYLK